MSKRDEYSKEHLPPGLPFIAVAWLAIAVTALISSEFRADANTDGTKIYLPEAHTNSAFSPNAANRRVQEGNRNEMR